MAVTRLPWAAAPPQAAETNQAYQRPAGQAHYFAPGIYRQYRPGQLSQPFVHQAPRFQYTGLSFREV
jgi:hypothetical protein